MRCSKCKNTDTKVLDSRVIENGRSIRRRRECELCKNRFTTFEKMEIVRFMVIKTEGVDEIYDKDKLENSILKACNKRDVSIEIIENIIGQLEEVWSLNKKAITSKRIGKDVLEKLKKVDEVAYVRYASVYYNFENTDDFMNFINE